MNVLEVTNLRIWEASTGRQLVAGSTFQVKAGSCLAIVGESGSGKSLTCGAIMRLNGSGLHQSGEIRFQGEDLLALPEKAMRQKRGKEMGLIVQHGMRAFDPSCVVGVQLRETLAAHYGWSREESTARLKTALESVRLKQPLEIMNKYPHQLSGGMLQRIMIALAIVLAPDLLIADEPTSALDAVSAYEVVEQLIVLRQTTGCAMLFVSHDLGAVKKIADEVLVMKAGEIVESGTTQQIFAKARHAYTRCLVSDKLALSEHFSRVKGGIGVAEG